MIGVIRASFTAEYCFKGLCETTVGRFTARLSSDDERKASTLEDRFMRQVAQDYSTFIQAIPWDEFLFWSKLRACWSPAGTPEGNVLRCWERRFEVTVAMLVKGGMGLDHQSRHRGRLQPGRDGDSGLERFLAQRTGVDRDPPTHQGADAAPRNEGL